MTKPATVGLNVYQGQDFTDWLVLNQTDNLGVKTPVDLTGYDAHMQARSEMIDLLPIIDWSTFTGEITIDGPTGKVMFNVTAAATRVIPTNNEFLSLVYDMILTSASQAERIIQGVINISPSVTRA